MNIMRILKLTLPPIPAQFVSQRQIRRLLFPRQPQKIIHHSIENADAISVFLGTMKKLGHWQDKNQDMKPVNSP